jgi:hypothetical protein
VLEERQHCPASHTKATLGSRQAPEGLKLTQGNQLPSVRVFLFQATQMPLPLGALPQRLKWVCIPGCFCPSSFSEAHTALVSGGLPCNGSKSALRLHYLAFERMASNPTRQRAGGLTVRVTHGCTCSLHAVAVMLKHRAAGWWPHSHTPNPSPGAAGVKEAIFGPVYHTQ